jgi:Mrp family chromosome partitioning ATPase
MDTTLTAQHQLLRANIESTMNSPAVILVTSARARDGKSVTAYGLAESLAEAGHRVVLVDARGPGQSSRPTPLRSSPDIVAHARLPISASDPRSSRTSIVSFVRDLRHAYDYTIVDGTTFLGASAGLLASVADGVLITVRVGRRQAEEDQFMVRTLAQSNARVIGVVAVEREAIVAFDGTRVGAPVSETRLPAYEATNDDIHASVGVVQFANS